MNHLHNEIKILKDLLVEMMDLVSRQVLLSSKSLMGFNKEIAKEILIEEKRINAFELKIDKSCENIFALFNPVANDLRFVLSTLKSNANLERIGDNAEGIANFVLDLEFAFENDLLNELQIEKMFSICTEMLENIKQAYLHDDTESARTLFEKDIELNELNNASTKIISNYILKNPDQIENLLQLLILIRKLERTGDLIKSIAEEIIYFVEAKVIRHGKKAIKGVN